jgi:outer membrane protein assembly factor BamD
LQSVVDRYPLYSGADEALYLLGQCYEGEIANVRNAPMRGSNAQSEAAKARMIQAFTKNAADAYSRILTRYPMMDRAEDAKRRLVALHQPVPTPTQAAIAQNRKEEESRHSSGMFGHLMGNFSRHPDVAQATKVGDPTLVDPKPVSATDVVAAANRAIFTPAGKTSDNKVSVETVKEGAPLPNEAAPRSDAPAATPDTATKAADTTPSSTEVETVPASNETAPAPAAAGSSGSGSAADANNGIGELKPNVAPDAQTPPAPAQVNELQQNADQQGQGSAASSSSSSSTNSSSSDNSQNMSSSKKKKKKHKLFF